MVDVQKRELILSPGSYIYLQDVTKGIIKVYSGPTSINPTQQEIPITYDPSQGRFMQASSMEAAVRRAPVAVEGYYIVLLNPAKDGKHPQEGSVATSPDLEIGRKIMVPGPANFSLWPGQAAEVIRGHQLKYNQYLIARVYNEEEARKNIDSAIVKVSEGTDDKKGKSSTRPSNFAVGTQFVIRGDEVSFYIPPTGISVLKNNTALNDITDEVEYEAVRKDPYIRSALTLERLEYCILVDEDGNKRYEKGPQVIFPKPSERFKEGKDEQGNATKKFRAVELNENQGIHLKVIAGYTEGDGPNKKEFKEGEELFITGKQTAIYYPREEHSVIKYEGKVKHFATAVPAGEGRYVMDRNTGVITLVKGPAMLLPDPRTQVLVRRILSKKQADLWYPGNEEVRNYNESLRKLQAELSGSSTTAVLSEGQVSSAYGSYSPDLTVGAMNYSGGVSDSLGAEKTRGGVSKSLMSHTEMARGVSNRLMSPSSRVDKEQEVEGDAFDRSNTYTPPRMLTLDTKFQGAPCIEVHTGYAVNVVNKAGGRRVERGPVAILMEYGESLEVLELSTGKPKTQDRIFRTVYLRVDNNRVSDIVHVETSDHVSIDLELGYRVSFEGDPSKWFQIENYVKHLCDHARSILGGKVRKMTVEEFYKNATDMIRDILLGTNKETEGPNAGKRSGMFFSENNMRVTDVEVLKVNLKDEKIRTMLDSAQHETVRGNINLNNLKRNLDFLLTEQDIKRKETEARTTTVIAENEMVKQQEASTLDVVLMRASNRAQEMQKRAEEEQLVQSVKDIAHEADIHRIELAADSKLQIESKAQALRLEYMQKEAEYLVQKMGALLPGFSEALLALGRQDVISKVAAALNVQTILGGGSISDTFRNAFRGTAIEKHVEDILKKAVPELSNGNVGSYMSPKA